jgi:hypothetical protein
MDFWTGFAAGVAACLVINLVGNVALLWWLCRKH